MLLPRTLSSALRAALACGVTLFAAVLPAQTSTLWVGTTDGKLRVLELSPSGKLTPKHALQGPRPLRFLAFHPKLPLVYGAVGKTVQSYRITDAGPVSEQKMDFGVRGTHLEIDPRGRFVFLASYGDGAVVAAKLDARGKIAAPGFSLRELCRRAHQVRAHASGRFVYAPCLGDDVVQIFRLGDRVQSLGRARLANGSGPRHMDFAPNGRFAYVWNELASTVYAYSLAPESGALTEIQALSALPEGRTEGSRSSDIHVSPNGRFVYGVHREPLDQVVTFAVAADGKLSIVGRTPTGGTHSRSFALTADGGLAVFGHSRTRDVIVRKVDKTSGVIGDQTDRIEVDAAAIFVGIR